LCNLAGSFLLGELHAAGKGPAAASAASVFDRFGFQIYLAIQSRFDWAICDKWRLTLGTRGPALGFELAGIARGIIGNVFLDLFANVRQAFGFRTNTQWGVHGRAACRASGRGTRSFRRS
jgi:hypothetical protein